MSTAECRHCGGRVAELAETCPHCGGVLPSEKMRQQGNWSGIGCGLLFLLGAAVYLSVCTPFL